MTSGRSDTTPSGGSHSLSLEVDLHQAQPPAGAALVINGGAGALRLWLGGFSLGDDVLSFSIICPDGVVEISKAPQEYTVNPPATVLVEAGGVHRIAFNLGDGSWTPDPPRLGSRLTARFTIPASDEAQAQNVWIGTIVSDPVALSED